MPQPMHQRYLPLLSNALTSSWLPRNETKRSVGRSSKIKRNARPPRHSNSFVPSLRMPMPLWAWDWPKHSASSHNASRHSTLSPLGNSRNRRSTPGAMERGLVKHLPQLFGSDGDQLSGPFESAVMSVGSLFQGSHLIGCSPIFALRVVCGFNFHFAQGNDVRPADNPDIFTARGGSQPPAQVFLGVCDC